MTTHNHTNTLRDAVQDMDMGHLSLGLGKLMDAGFTLNVGPTLTTDFTTSIEGGPFFASLHHHGESLFGASFGGAWADAIMGAARTCEVVTS